MGQLARTDNDSGSVKSNIGHLEGCSGIAGIIKTVLMLEKGVLLPNANFEKLNPSIDAAKLKIQVIFHVMSRRRGESDIMQVVTEPTPWPTEGLRRASVSSFGFGGANTHVVLDDAYSCLKSLGLQGNHFTKTQHRRNQILKPPSACLPNGEAASLAQPSNRKLLVISSADQPGIQRNLDALLSHVDGKPAEYLDDFLHTLSSRRTHHKWRVYAVVDPRVGLQPASFTLSNPVRCVDNARLAFCFTGQGAQYARMAHGLLCYPAFINSLEHSQNILTQLGCPWDLLGMSLLSVKKDISCQLIVFLQ